MKGIREHDNGVHVHNNQPLGGKNRKDKDGQYSIHVLPCEQGCDSESKDNGGDENGDHKDGHNPDRSHPLFVFN